MKVAGIPSEMDLDGDGLEAVPLSVLPGW